MAENATSLLLSKKKFLKQTDWSLSSLNRAIYGGKIKTVRLGKRVFLPRSELERLVNAADFNCADALEVGAAVAASSQVEA